MDPASQQWFIKLYDCVPADFPGLLDPACADMSSSDSNAQELASLTLDITRLAEKKRSLQVQIHRPRLGAGGNAALSLPWTKAELSLMTEFFSDLCVRVPCYATVVDMCTDLSISLTLRSNPHHRNPESIRTYFIRSLKTSRSSNAMVAENRLETYRAACLEIVQLRPRMES